MRPFWGSDGGDSDRSGVYGKTAEELAEVDHFSSWVFLGNEWRVEVVDEIETIRVLGPLQAAG